MITSTLMNISGILITVLTLLIVSSIWFLIPLAPPNSWPAPLLLQPFLARNLSSCRTQMALRTRSPASSRLYRPKAILSWRRRSGRLLKKLIKLAARSHTKFQLTIILGFVHTVSLTVCKISHVKIHEVHEVSQHETRRLTLHLDQNFLLYLPGTSGGHRCYRTVQLRPVHPHHPRWLGLH